MRAERVERREERRERTDERGGRTDERGEGTCERNLVEQFGCLSKSRLDMSLRAS